MADGPEVLAAEPRPLDRRLLLALAVVVLAVALVLGGLAGVDRVRGGASSPTAVADRVLSALDREDLQGLVRVVEPGERAALLRLGGALTRHLADLDLPVSVGGGAPGRGGPLAGLRLDLTGATPHEESRAGDVAVVGLGDLVVRVRSDPRQARGLLRTLLAYRHLDAPTDLRYPLADLPGLGVRTRLVTVERSGRWYLSVLGTLLGPGIPPGSLADVEALPPTWSPTPEAAVEATVRALLDGRTRHDVSALAATLDASGSDAVQLWAAQLAIVGLDKPPPGLSAFGTSSGPSGPDRAEVRVETLRVGDGTGFDLAGRCLTSQDEHGCLHRSGYRYSGGVGSLSALELLGHDGAFSLTTVHGEGGWRTSLPDTLADALAAYGNGLTRAQVLALVGEEHLDRPDGDVRPDEPRDVAFSTGGYTVRTLHVDEPGLYRVVPSPTGSNRSAVYDADGRPSIQPFYPNDSVYRLTPGDHTLLVWADDAFAATLADGGPDPYVQRLEVRTVR